MALDSRAIIRYVNAAGQKRFGPVVGRGLESALGRPIATALKPLIARALKGETMSLDVALAGEPSPDGSLSGTLAPDHAENGDVVGVLCVFIEGSPRLETAAAPRRLANKSEAQETDLHRINDVLPALVGHLDANLRFLYLNAAYRRYLGDAAAGAVGKHMSEVLGQATFERRRPFVDRALAGKTVHFDAVLETRSGEARVLSHVYRPDLDDQGRVRGLFVFATDVTERNEAERRLEHREIDARRLMDSLPAFISRLDRDRHYLYINERLCKFYGRTADDLIGKRLSEVIGGDALGDRELYLERAFAGESVDFEATLLDVTGQERLFAQVFTPEIDSDDVVQSIVAFSVDITTQRAAEKKLRRAERDLRVINDSVPVTIVRLNRELHYLYANAFFARLIGKTPQDIIGRHIRDVLGPDADEERRPYYARALNGEIVNYEGVTRSSSAGERFIARTYIPEFDSNGHVESFIAIGVDVTEQRKTERRIRESEHEIRLINDSAPIVIARLDNDRRYRYVNAHYAKMLARPAEDFVGRHAREVVGDAAYDIREPYAARTLAGEMVNYEAEIETPNAGRRILSHTNIPMKDADGAIDGYLVIAIDVTERREAEDALTHKTEQLELILDALPVLAAQIDANYRYRFVNRAYAEFYGVPAEQIIGQTVEQFLGSERWALVKPYDDAALNGKAMKFTASHKRAGEELSLDTIVMPDQVGTGNIQGYLVFSQDVTETLANARALAAAKEGAEAANRAKSEFLATMSHEIRTPMNGIIGMTDLLLDSSLDSQQRNFADAVRDSAQALLLLINDILDISKLEAGRIELEETPFSLEDMIEGALKPNLPRAAERANEITLFIEPGVPNALIGDPGRLRQILLNLIGNAVKFTKNGAIALKVSRQGGDDNRPLLRFEVIDNGPGIAPAIRPKLFQKFTQADSSIARSFGGTGLGLSICRELVTLMGGNIDVKSEPGHGATFFFTLALPRSEHASPEIAPKLLGGIRLLLADDDPLGVSLVRLQLEAAGAIVHAVASAEEALLAARTQRDGPDPFDAILLDQRLKGPLARDLVRAFRAKSGPSQLRLIAIGGRTERIGSDEASRGAGFDAWIEKPTRPRLMIEAIARVCGRLDAPSGTTVDQSKTLAPSPARQVDDNLRLAILLAEDNAINQRLAVTLLEKEGHKVEVVSNGRLAIEAVERRDYDLVLMDVQMPEVDGLEATKRIRALSGARSQVPIIAMTANAMKGDEETCLAVGMNGYMAKPIDRQKLSDLVREWGASGRLRQPDAGALSVGGDAPPILLNKLLDDLEAQIGRDSLTKLITEQIEDTRTRLKDIGRALAAGDLDAVKQLVHSLVSTAGGFGLMMLSARAAAVERACRDGQRATAISLAGTLDGIASRSLDALSERYPECARKIA